ncbi:hypothetical protein TNCV_1053501 [Trichonephila clavipes]|nr:hypothetical protein TNCV_1053501 [Trichonephila clavipes]
MVPKATANDRRHLALCHDEFRESRSGVCRSGGISNKNNNSVKLRNLATNSWSVLALFICIWRPAATKDSCLVTSSSPVPLKTCRVGQRCTLNLSRDETSSRWCVVVVRRGDASSGVVHVT